MIPGYHQVRLPVRVTPTDGSAAVGIFEPHSEMVETHGVLIARSVSPIQSGQIVVQILNPLPFPATLQAEEAIGCFCCGAQVDVVSLEPCNRRYTKSIENINFTFSLLILLVVAPSDSW